MKSKAWVILLIFVTWTSCEKKDDPNPVAATDSMVATVDGSAWTAAAPAAIKESGTFFISAAGADGTRIDLLISGTSLATYVVDGMVGSSVPDNYVTFVPAGTSISNPLYVSSNLDAAAIGEIKLTEVDETNKTISGTFTSKVKRMVPEESVVQISNGSFTKIAYTTPSTGTPTTTTSSASAKIDNVVFTATSAGGAVSFGKIQLGFTGASKSIGFTIPATITAGSYGLNSLGSTYSATVMDGANIYVSTSGSIVITQHDTAGKRIVGTFNFTAQEFPIGSATISVTEGQFEVTYQ